MFSISINGGAVLIVSSEWAQRVADQDNLIHKES